MSDSLIPEPLLRDMAEREQQREEADQFLETLTVKRIGVWVPACESRRHQDHPGITCAEADEWIRQRDEIINQALQRSLTGSGTVAPTGLLAVLDTLSAKPTPEQKAMAILAPYLAREPLYRP